MIDLSRSGVTQLTLESGEITRWRVTLDEEELYTLPANFTIHETFEIRKLIEKWMDYAHEQGRIETEAKKDSEIKQILDIGNTQLNALKDENERIALALERHIISQED